MRNSIIIICLLSLSVGFGQTLDFGLELRTNSNRLSNRFNQSVTPTTAGHQTDELGSFEIPEFNFGFFDDNGESVYVRFDEVEMTNNVEIPLYARLVTKNDMYFDFKVSGGKYRITYQGRLFRDAAYYSERYGNFEAYQANYGGALQGEPVNGNPDDTYNDRQAYINWFDSQVNSDPYSQASALLVEEFKFRSFQLWVGKKFLEHKRVQPFVNAGVNFRTAVSSFKRKHFEIDDNFLGQVLTKRDLSALTDDIPVFSQNTFGFGLRAGFDIYRYHFALSSEYSINLSTTFRDKPVIFDYQNVGAGFRTLSMSIGVDLISFDARTKNNRDIIYNEEFQTLSSKLDKNRASSININIKAPIHSKMNSGRTFSLITIRDSPDPLAGNVNLNWQSLSFSTIDRIDWLPKFEVGYRYNLLKSIDFEVNAGFSRVIIDTKVQELNARLIFNETTNEYEYDEPNSNANYAVYRSTFAPIFLGGNVYAKVLSKDAFDLRVFGGAAINWFALITPDAISEFGVNGKGNDIYKTTEGVLFHGDFSPQEIENADYSYYSDYAEDVDFNQSAQTLLLKHQNRTRVTNTNFGQTTLYPTVNGGVELEFNRFLCGLSGEFSIVKVDNFLVDNYYNISLNFGYLIITNNRLNRKLRN